jgi:hypothetical protein
MSAGPSLARVISALRALFRGVGCVWTARIVRIDSQCSHLIGLIFATRFAWSVCGASQYSTACAFVKNNGSRAVL